MGSSTQLSVVEFSELTKYTKDVMKEEDKASLAVIKAVPDSTNKMVVNGKDGYAMKPVSILKAVRSWQRTRQIMKKQKVPA